MKSVILLGGRAGAGKNWIATNHFTDYTQLAFADFLKDSAASVYNIDKALFYTQKGKQKRFSANMTYRDILVEYGEALKVDNPDIFIDKICEKISESSAEKFIITDFRFPPECFKLKEKLGDGYNMETIKIIRPGQEIIADNICEHALNDFNFDYEIFNIVNG